MISTGEKISFEYEDNSNQRRGVIAIELNSLKESGGNIKPVQSNSCLNLACALRENKFNNEKQFVDQLEIQGIQSSENHSIRFEDPVTEENSSVSLQEINNVISTITSVVRPYTCHQCGLRFDRISQFDNHRRRVHNQERSQICQICGKGFFRQTDLKTHLNIHLGTNRCMCKVCGRKFNHVSNLIRHSRTHSGVKPYPCTICGKRFTQTNTLARHKAIHERGDEIIDCCFCDKQFISENSLKKHMQKLHSVTEKTNSEDICRIIKRQHYCKICGESFQFVELLRDHEKIHENVESLECKSCNQKFRKTWEIIEHRCGKPKLLSANAIRTEKGSEEESVVEVIKDKSKLDLCIERGSILTELGGIDEDSKEPFGSNEIHNSTENSRIHRLENFIEHELDDNLTQATITSPAKLAQDKQTKETIVYVTTKQLANMDTGQVVDTANHFLHQHLMELATEISLQTENIRSRANDGKAVVSEMMNSCWKEIDTPDVNKSETEKKDSQSLKTNSQSIIYIHASEKDGLIFPNEATYLLGNLAPNLTPENSINVKDNSTPIKNSSSHIEFEKIETQTCENEYVEKNSSNLIQNETTSKKSSFDVALYENTKRNFREPNQKLERIGSSTVKATKGLKSPNTRNFLSEENSVENNNILVETINAGLSHNMFEELLKINAENINTVISKSENQAPTLRLVQTENGEEFYDLLITNCPERSENFFNSEKIPTASVNEDLNVTQSELVPESLLKLVQLENGQRILELTETTLLDETEQWKEAENVQQTTANNTFIEKSVLENIDHKESTVENLSQNKYEKIFYLAQNNKDNLIDFFEIETLGTQEQNSFNLVSDEVIENVSQTSFDNFQAPNRNKNSDNDESPIDNESCEELLGLIQTSPVKQNEKSKIDLKKTKSEDGPMVRLVQNEDGAQFFELIRGDLEFDEMQDFELVEANGFDERQNTSIVNLGSEFICASNNTTKVESDITRRKKQKNDAKKYNCDVCKKSFSKGHNYRQHIGTHFADQQKFKCKECGILFAWKSTLNKHMATHRAGGQPKFVCEICPKVYTTLSQVNEHVKRDHLKERNHKCVHCAKTFFKKFDLKIHIRTHTKERPYKCRVCNKSFHHQSHIIRHERIHSGERPYACNICEKTFTQLGSLKNHRQRHQELKIDILDYQMDEDDPLPRTTL